ncbi:MAG: VWA domain-containing protein [Acidobacteriales bacterium]|nr:MAG: VWA domain-containing protein [Terriglobales bacterium]
MELALREALALVPSGMVPRIALISDGRENRGSIARGAALARQLGVPLDTLALAGRPQPEFMVESAIIPPAAFTGERFAIDLVVRSPRRATGVVELTAEGKPLGTSPVAIGAGASRLRVHASISEPGAISLTGAIRLGTLGEARFSRVVTLRRPKLLYLSEDPPGSEKHLLEALRSAHFEIHGSRDALTPALETFQLVVFNNWDLDSLPAARKTAIENYVKQGGGLLVIGGERNLYRERDRGVDDPFEMALPASLAPPRSPEGRCVVLVVDKSSSMQGRKMDLARLAAVGVVENLRPTDMIGVLVFDTTHQWTAPIRQAGDRALLKRLISGIQADGGTQIGPALSEAHNKTLPVEASFRHIVLLTDGVSEAGDSVSMAREAGLERITISTVGIGQDVNRPYLEQIASLSGGKAYFLTNPAGLEQIVLRDVLEHTGSTVVEEPVPPRVLRNVELIEGVGMETAPPLNGYVRFVSKPAAETILQVGDKDPLLVRWQHGLGRSIVFASDAKSRWAEHWVSWEGFDKFWVNVARDLLPHAQAAEASLRYDSAAGELVVDYRLGPNAEVPRGVPEVFVFGAGGFQEPVEVRKLAEGLYQGRVANGGRQGPFRVRPLAESTAFPEVGLDPEVDESRGYGNDAPLLGRVAALTGGRFNPSPQQVFDPGGRSVPSTLRLWPGLLALAILLNFAELVLRRLHHSGPAAARS